MMYGWREAEDLLPQDLINFAGAVTGVGSSHITPMLTGL
jgi:hypothetical protein